MSKQRTRWSFWILLLAGAIAALLYTRCGAGFGLGGSGAESIEDRPAVQPVATPPAPGKAADAAPPRCEIRVDGTGVTLGGEPIEVDGIASRCPGGVELTVTGDARYGEAEAVREAVRAAGLELLDRSQ